MRATGSRTGIATLPFSSPHRLLELGLLLGLLAATTVGCVFVPVGGYAPRPRPVVIAPPPAPVVVAPWPGYGWRRPYWW